MKFRLLLTCTAFSLVTAPAFANEFDGLLRAKKYVEAEKAANAKLAREPANADALAAKSAAILGIGNEERIEEAIKLADQCVSTHAKDANCHVALGTARGAKAMNGGMLAAASLAGKIRDSFKKAVELDPRHVDARFSLMQFYLMAPGFMGGGADKAEELVTQTAAIVPEAAKLMAAQIDLRANRTAKAEAAVSAARPGTDVELQELQENLAISVGNKYMADKKYAEAERVFRDTQKRYPESDSAAYFIARNFQEQGKHKEAVAGFELMIASNPRPHLHYRIAKSLQVLGDKARATAAFEKALSYKAGLYKQFRTDSEAQLKALKG